MPHPKNIIQQYAVPNLYDIIVNGLISEGKELTSITREDLSMVDEFHVGGAAMSLELAQKAQLSKGCLLLDIGCGLGGPSRMLADVFKCQVTGVDITPEYIETATKLSQLVYLDQYTHFLTADALDLPFEDQSFDVVWTQHVQMNIEDKPAFYQEVDRILKRGGYLIYYDIFQGIDQNVIYPTPWSDDGSQSFLFSNTELHTILGNLSFKNIFVADQTKAGIRSFENLFQRLEQQGRPGLGFHLLLGESADTKLKNVQNNLVSKAIILESAIFRKS